MAIQLDTTRIAAQTASAAAQNEVADAQAQGPAPLLGGENLKVSSGAMSDLEKLVAQLKNETDNAKMSVTQRRISELQTVLNSMSDRISEKERETLITIETLNGEKAEVEGELARHMSDKTMTQGRIAELDVKIAELEKAIERAVQEGEDHRKQVEKLKEQRSREQEKLDQIDKAISSANAKLSGIDVKIAECTQTIAQTTLNEVANALRIAARNDSVPSSPDVSDESNADRVQKEKKAEVTDIGNIIRDSLDKIDEMIRSALDEAQMKVEG